MPELELYDVGGFLRDEILGIPSKDRDFAVVAESFESLGKYLQDKGYEIYHVYEDKFTYRCKSPTDSQFYDYVWCRTNEVYVDGDLISVEPGTLLQDLERRDFTINAMARKLGSDVFIDPFNGYKDCQDKMLRCVGNPADRFSEDPRRMIRAIRFIVKCRMTPDKELVKALKDPNLVSLLDNSKYKDCVVTELNKAMKMDPGKVCGLMTYYSDLADVLFNSKKLDLHLTFTAKQNKLKAHYEE